MKNLCTKKYSLCVGILFSIGLMHAVDEETYVVQKPCPHATVPLNPDRPSSYPYISGDAFREICDFIIDETKIPFNPKDVKDGDTVFLHGDHLDYFFSTIHDKIKARYILVTHNSDYDIPGHYVHYLDDETLAGWFGQNVVLKHPKMFPLPIGLANRYWRHGNPEIMDKALAKFGNKAHIKKLLYMNFSITHPHRRAVHALFLRKPFCTAYMLKNGVEHAGFDPYHHLKDLAHHTFVLSPRGNGLDAHRTWETLLMGSIPIVETSASDSMYDDLPVLIIHKWQEITEQFLNESYEKIMSRTYTAQKLYAPYWIEQIYAYQESIRTNQRT